MPSFMFACGFSYRLTRLEAAGAGRARAGLSAVRGAEPRARARLADDDGFGEEFKTWAEVTPENVRLFLVKLVKANLWEVLAIIGVGQVLIMPVIAAGAKARWPRWGRSRVARRALVLVQFRLRFRPSEQAGRVSGHVGLHRLGWRRVRPACRGQRSCWRGRSRTTSGRGGLAGPSTGPAARLVGCVLMGVGYGLSCLSMLYDGEVSDRAVEKSAASPVLPPFARAEGRPCRRSLAEPPFVQPPPPSQRPHNYWMMNKRAVSLPFVLFATGLAIGGLWSVRPGVRLGAVRVGLFRTFGQNALAAYVIHQHGRGADPHRRPQGRSPGGLPGRTGGVLRDHVSVCPLSREAGRLHPAMTPREPPIGSRGI